VNLVSLIKQSLQELERAYDNKKDFLTEADVVSFLVSSLREKIKEGLRVHSQLRPFYQTREGYHVIKEKKGTWDWGLQRKANEGAVFDVVVVDDDDKYFKQAYKKAKEDQRVSAREERERRERMRGAPAPQI
jgi:hypothetical protein